MNVLLQKPPPWSLLNELASKLRQVRSCYGYILLRRRRMRVAQAPYYLTLRGSRFFK